MSGEKGMVDTAILLNFLTSYFNGIVNSPSNPVLIILTRPELIYYN